MSDWIKKRKREGYYKKAKREHHRSRAYYKLIHLNDKYKFLNHQVKEVIDVCCAPGGWIEAIQSVLGNKVFILGIDMNKIKPFDGNFSFLKADITQPEIKKLLLERFPDKVDLVVADCSMKTSGASNLDVERQNYLVQCTFENIVKPALKKGGHFVAKVFQGRSIYEIKKDFQDHFSFCKFTKPKSSLPSSREMYLICKDYMDL